MLQQLVDVGHTISVWFIPVVLAITMHEAAHGWVAEKLGDDTARRHGRVTFNPLRHVDPVGTILLPGILLLVSNLAIGAGVIFGWAKPVPVAFHRLRHPKQDMIWVALAGPGINLALGLFAAALLHLFAGESSLRLALWIWETFHWAGLAMLGDDSIKWVSTNLANFIWANVAFACFNMLPLPPLDGGRVMVGILPLRMAIPYARVEPYGILILLGFAFLLPLVFSKLGIEFNPLFDVLWPVINAVHVLVTTLGGW